jgi:CDP-6-deoxy-D-xylo-4-hexulose-3-dehydrase
MKNGWLGLSKRGAEFEAKSADLLGNKFGIFVNSGSSANLLAITAAKLFYKWEDGDEVIVPACGFPTSINPIIQNNLCPVFIDINKNTLNINAYSVERAISKKTKAIVVVHSLGFPCEMSTICSIAKKHNLIIIEDCCDALCSEYQDRLVGSFGDIATTSFYPAHLISTGGGGLVCSNNQEIAKIIRSLACWGRSCNCHGTVGTKKDGVCGKRFSNWLKEFPEETYDHKYLYSTIGYSLEGNEISAAIGLEQLKRINFIIDRRKKIYNIFYDALYNKYEGLFYFVDYPFDSAPVPFCFPLTTRNKNVLSRKEIVCKLEDAGIQTRQFFGGNLLRHGIYNGTNYRIAETLENSDYVTFNTFFIGVWEEMTDEEVGYILETFNKILKGKV